LIDAVVTLARALAHHAAARVALARAISGRVNGIPRPCTKHSVCVVLLVRCVRTVDTSALAGVCDRALLLIDQLDDLDDEKSE
jgi:hypothetical protein